MRYIANPVEVDVAVITEVGGNSNLFVTLDWKDAPVEVRALTAGMIARYVPVVGDYFVRQSDGYEYINPKAVLERKYSPAGNFMMLDIAGEAARASELHGEHYASLHECWAVLFEEVDEIWEIVRLKKRQRDAHKLRRELVQVAAVAIKGIKSMDRFVEKDPRA